MLQFVLSVDFEFKRVAGALVLVLLTAGLAFGNDEPSATAEHGAFAFPDLTGVHLLSTSHPPRPDAIHTSLCSDGHRYPVMFERRQAERAGNDGRAVPANSESLSGSVFRIRQGQTDAAACFLASDTLLADAAVLPPKETTGSCDQSVIDRLAAARSRAIVSCHRLADLPENQRMVLVEFEPRDGTALASLVLLDADRSIFNDYPAEYRGPGADIWRVDDGGVLSAEWFHIVFALRRGGVYTLGVDWVGSEGSNLAVLVSSADGFNTVLNDYWYQAPK